MSFFQGSYVICTGIFFIDSDVSNPIARHVYEKSSSEHKGCFQMQEGVPTVQETNFIVKNIPSIIYLVKLNLNDYPVIQNMARFYAYDLSKSFGWAIEKIMMLLTLNINLLTKPENILCLKLKMN